MYLKRMINDIECEIKDQNEINTGIFEQYSQLWNNIHDILSAEIPVAIKEEVQEEKFTSCINKAVDYVIDGLQETAISNGTFIEDGLCYFYDLIENEFEDKDDYELFYTKFWCKPSQHRLVMEFAKGNMIHHETVKDPMIHAVEEAVENAYQRNVFDDEIVNDVYMQINDVINDDAFIKLIADDYMIKNSL